MTVVRPERETSDLDDALSTFESVRGRLFGIAYRMLGSVSEAEDIVQEVWIRWQTTDRDVVRSVGGFRPVRRFVDAQLLSGIEAAGGRIYRTHGLGYVLRRLASGQHTWQVDADSFRKEGIVDREWTGFHSSRELEADERDLP